ncbi:molybdopterin oxidoreductase [Pengzhenrongella sicca]|uniref:Molybdopterin oxidoreductase n=1 Tax=Pengzhenrongella sicca TaxID=2819238 RepID=A0A8A4ZBH7_9MICO|nr:molybdopterin oxidoreductase [Pengzhenrongella sicca]QTE28771.1 molybdopterin oxidoreductase [Pengzhenrongella sicca]
MTINGARQGQRRAHAPAWFTVAAWGSLGLLLLGGFAGAVGLG